MKSAFSATRMSIARRVVTVVGASALVLGGVSACSDDTVDSATDAVASATDDAKDNAAEATSKAKEAGEDAKKEAAEATSKAKEAGEEAKDEAAAATSEAKADMDDKEYSMDEVEKHNNVDDCWAVIDGDVYDLTDWVGQHPGGADKIEQLCGTDGTAMFEGHHEGDAHPHAKIESFKIGELDD